MKKIMTDKFPLKWRHRDLLIGSISLPNEIIEKFKKGEMFYIAPAYSIDENGTITLRHISICPEPINEELKMRKINNDSKN